MGIVPAAEQRPGRRWDFVMPDGTPHRHWYSAAGLPFLLSKQLEDRKAELAKAIERVDGFDHADAARLLPGWRGELFDIHECVAALFGIQLSRDNSEAA